MEPLGVCSDLFSVSSVVNTLCGDGGVGGGAKQGEDAGDGGRSSRPSAISIPLCASPPKSTRSRSTPATARSLFSFSARSLIIPSSPPFSRKHVGHTRYHPQKLRPEVPLPKGCRVPGRYHGWNLCMSPAFPSPTLRVFTLPF